jgi:hypothetical protein
LVTEGGWITGQTIYASGGFTAHWVIRAET